MSQKETSKKERIVDAFARCLALKSYDAISIREIAEEADIPVGSVYYYFKSKEDIFLAQLSRPHWELMSMFEEWGESEPVTDGSFAAMADELVKLGSEYLNRAAIYQPSNGLLPHMWASCVSNEAVRELTAQEYDQCYETIARALRRKGLSPDADAYEVAKLLAALFDGVRVYSTVYPERLEFDKFFEVLKAFGEARA